MKQIYSIAFFAVISIMPFRATFDWQTATSNGSTVTQTVNSITATVTTSNNDAEIFGYGWLHTYINYYVITESDNSYLTIPFNTPVNVESIFTFIPYFSSEEEETNILFTPTGGINSTVTEVIGSGEVVTLNWEGVTAITLTVNGGGLESFGIDDIRLGTTLSNSEFSMSENKLELFPNPSNSFINISGLQREECYSIFNTLGKRVLKGEVSINKPIDVQNLSTGLYFVKFKNSNTLKFIKK